MATEAELKRQALKDIAIAAAEATYHYTLIAKSIGKDYETLINWRKSDEDFSTRLEEARYRFLQKQVRSAKPEFLLERLEPEVFKERKETETKNSVEFAGASKEELEKLLDDYIASKNRE